MLLFTERLKLLCKEKVEQLKLNNSESTVKATEDSGIISSSSLKKQGVNNNNFIRREFSNERMQEKRNEVSKTREEKEYLQKRTNEILIALASSATSRTEKFNLNILNKANFLISDVKSDVDSRTVISDSSMASHSSIGGRSGV